eukprot:709859-Pyramimonas_sp.AAC.1
MWASNDICTRTPSAVLPARTSAWTRTPGETNRVRVHMLLASEYAPHVALVPQLPQATRGTGPSAPTGPQALHGSEGPYGPQVLNRSRRSRTSHRPHSSTR